MKKKTTSKKKIPIKKNLGVEKKIENCLFSHT
jgi:hypothetical protein